MSVSFTYTLSPPGNESATHDGAPVPESGTASFPLSPSSGGRSATEDFYAAAVPALRDAQARLMDILTAWKDAVGDAEKHKENTGKAAFGKGKANMLMAANRAAEESSEEEESEDEW